MIVVHRSLRFGRIVFALVLALASFACGSASSNDADGAPGANTGGSGGAQTDGNARIDVGDGAVGEGASNGASGDAGDAVRGAADASDGAVGSRDTGLDAARESSGDAATVGDAGPSRSSAGCGLPATGTGSYVRQTITVGNVTREYFLWVPRTYDPSRPYPIVFRWHGSTGNGLSGGLEIEASSGENALIASPSGIGGVWDFSPTGVDVALFDRLLAQLESTYCVDTGRVFSYGFSAGGGFTNVLGCVRSGVVRAVAPVEGYAPVTMCSGRVAARITHSPDDTAVPIARGIEARSLFLAADGCGTTAMSVSPSPCVRYQGCAVGYPVDWCQTSGEHNPQGSITGPSAWSFFDSLR